ncbi:MAG: hypothetical protein ACYTHM_24010, partial [Planctomycetota bacterium]
MTSLEHKRRSLLTGLLLPIVLVCLSCRAAHPQASKKDVPPPPKEEAPKKLPEPKYLSAWAKVIFREKKCCLIATGKVTKLYRLPTGISVASFIPREILHGAVEETKPLLVISPDPRFLKTGDELVLFLRRER